MKKDWNWGNLNDLCPKYFLWTRRLFSLSRSTSRAQVCIFSFSYTITLCACARASIGHTTRRLTSRDGGERFDTFKECKQLIWLIITFEIQRIKFTKSFFLLSQNEKKKVNWDEEHIQRATKVLFVPIKLRKWEKV